MTFGSVCSGIEAATVAWAPLGWRPLWVAEIDAFPCALLKHYYLEVPNYGDFTKIRDAKRPDVLVGGTPCQSFSVAGKRGGLDDARGVLAFEFLALAGRLRPTWIVFENVPGLLSSDEGRDFGAFVGALGKLGYGWAYRILDAQFFGLAQRRERLFLVGYLGDWRPPVAVLFEPESLRRDTPPSREAGKRIAPTLEGRAGRSGANNTATSGGLIGPSDICPDVAYALNAHGGAGRSDGALRADGFDTSEDGTGRGTPLVPIGFYANDFGGDAAHDLSPTLRSMEGGGGNHPAVAFQSRASSSQSMNPADVAPTLDVCKAGGTAIAFNLRGREVGAMPEPSEVASVRSASGGSSRSYVVNGNSTPEVSHDLAMPLRANDGSGNRQALSANMGVRRLTPRECERLQGFPDGYTNIPYRGKGAADGPRYKSLGNSMAVPVIRHIGKRIQLCQEILNGKP